VISLLFIDPKDTTLHLIQLYLAYKESIT